MRKFSCIVTGSWAEIDTNFEELLVPEKKYLLWSLGILDLTFLDESCLAAA